MIKVPEEGRQLRVLFLAHIGSHRLATLIVLKTTFCLPKSCFVDGLALISSSGQQAFTILYHPRE